MRHTGRFMHLLVGRRVRTLTVRGRCDTHLRRSGAGRSPRLCAHGAPLLAWIPAYAGTTTYLSLATFKAPGFFASLRVNLASVIFPRTVVGFRRDDQGAERRQNQRNAILIFVAPAQPGVQAFARRSAPFLRLDPGLRRDDNSLSLAGFNARLFAILRANRCAAIVPGQSWVFPRLANKTQLTTRPETREH